MHFQHEEIQAQYRVELAELAISLEEMIDFYEIQNAANNKTNLKSLSNEDFHTLQNPKISSPINHKKNNKHFQDNKISNEFVEIENKNKILLERFSRINQTNYNPTKVRRPPVYGFIDHLIEGKEIVPDTSSGSFTVQSTFKQELESRHLPAIVGTFQWELRGLAGIH